VTVLFMDFILPKKYSFSTVKDEASEQEVLTLIHSAFVQIQQVLEEFEGTIR